jgi:hypothetical protein
VGTSIDRNIENLGSKAEGTVTNVSKKDSGNSLMKRRDRNKWDALTKWPVCTKGDFVQGLKDDKEV